MNQQGRAAPPTAAAAQASARVPCPIPTLQIVYPYDQMKILKYLAATIFLTLVISFTTSAQTSRSVAITVDDLPYAAGS